MGSQYRGASSSSQFRGLHKGCAAQGYSRSGSDISDVNRPSITSDLLHWEVVP